ncbi:TlpA family protein disulfide reductase [PVC group bacterium]|nr:TlpA family protein disulfide reductase [PVC group bacterium]
MADHGITIRRLIVRARKLTIVLTFLFGLSLNGMNSPQAAQVGQQASQWVVSEWVNSEPISLDQLKGKVVVIDFFQLWCPGCNRFSIPLMLQWEKKYKNAADVQLVGIHTVFEGHDYQTAERLREYVKEKGIQHPVGMDAHVSDTRLPETMIRYQTKGTPEMAIVDKQGVIRFQKFGSFDIGEAESLIAELRRAF